MLKQAKDKVSKLDQNVQNRILLREGDMRGFDLDQTFNLITIPYRAFLHLMTVGDQKQALYSIHRHLTDEGKLVFNVLIPTSI